MDASASKPGNRSPAQGIKAMRRVSTVMEIDRRRVGQGWLRPPCVRVLSFAKIV